MFRKFVYSSSVSLVLLYGWVASANAQSVTKQQIQSLLPVEQDLQGFVRVLPGSGASRGEKGEMGEVTPTVSVAPNKDLVIVKDDPSTSSLSWFSNFDQATSIGAAKCLFGSLDDSYDLSIETTVCDSPQIAKEQLAGLHRLSTVWRSGRLTGSDFVGNESLVSVSNGKFKTLAFRYGRLIAVIEGSSSNHSSSYQDFPLIAIEAVAYQILLRASQQTALVGVSTQSTHLAVDGHALPQNALLVSGQTYVPVAEFAKAMGLASQWNTKTGALTLTGAGHKTVALTAGSMGATIGGVKAAALSVPVLKQDGEPVMTLTDLLAVTGDTSQAGVEMVFRSKDD